MQIVIVTAEPFGGYHLEPLLKDMLEDKLNNYTYLIPYQDSVQGSGLPGLTVSWSLESLYHADRLVITGGDYSAWTASIASVAKTLGIPILYTELAYIGDSPIGSSIGNRPDKAAAASVNSASKVASLFKLPPSEVIIVGAPRLDCLDVNSPIRVKPLIPVEASNVLIVSSVGLDEKTQWLIDAAVALRKAGASAKVKPHPRESLSLWDKTGLQIVPGNADVKTLLEETDYAVISVGSFSPLLLSSGIPTVSILESNHLGAPKEFLPFMALSLNGSDILNLGLWEEARLNLSKGLQNLEQIIGPIGGSAQRIINFWKS